MHGQRLGCILLALLTLLACQSPSPNSLSLVLVPPTALPGEIDAELAIEGLSALLLARLRALPDVHVRIDAQACAGAVPPNHVLRVVRELTTESALTTLRLERCQDGRSAVEQMVQPRDARRDWSAEAAWWVGTQLQAPPPRPAPGEAVDEVQMQRFLVALARMKRRTAIDIEAAHIALTEISQLQPQFAQAQAYRAAAVLLASEYDLIPLAEALQQADTGIEAALAEAPDLGMAHAARGLYWMNQDRYAEAIPQLARAAALEPGDATILLWLGNALLYNGAPKDAMPWLERALELDPELVSVRISLGEAACLAGDQASCQRFLGRDYQSPMEGFMGALLLAHQGRYEEASVRLQQPLHGVNAQWIADLRADLCLWFHPPSCINRQPPMAAATQSASSPIIVDPETERPIIDLWRLDLGLSDWMRAAAVHPDLRPTLLTELIRLKAGGLALPILQQMQDCLQPTTASANQADPQWAALRQFWQCPSPAMLRNPQSVN